MRLGRIVCISVLMPVMTAAAASFNTTDLPYEDPGATVFLAQADEDPAAELALLEGHTLTLYMDGVNASSARSIELPMGTQAFDIVDVTGDGVNDLVFTNGGQCSYLELRDVSEAPKPQLLFQLGEALAYSSWKPSPRVLVITYNDKRVFALPFHERLELRTFDGQVLEEMPLSALQAQDQSYTSTFTGWSVDPPQIGPAGALELRINAVVDSAPALPGTLEQGARAPGRHRLGTPLQTMDAGDRPPSAWPWFPLRVDGESEQRVLYALAGPEYQNTLIRMRWPETRDLPEGGDAFYVSPERRYPGAIALEENELPDFNGDGFVDLLLWKAPTPGTSIDSLTRAMREGTWPLRLTAHLYEPSRGLYEAKPRGPIELRIPTLWFIARSRRLPMRHLLLRDFNGDGNTDIALSPSSESFAIWLYDEGLRRRSDYSKRILGGIQEIAIAAPLGGDAGSVIVLKAPARFIAVQITPD